VVIIQGALERGDLYQFPRLAANSPRRLLLVDLKNTTIIISSHPELAHGNGKAFLKYFVLFAFLLLGRRVQCIVLAHHDLRVPLGYVGQVG
jgi:hypothetical protein